MKRLQIDFARRGLRRTLHHTPPAVWLIACAGVLAAAAAILAGHAYREQRLDFEAKLAARARTEAVFAAVPARPAPQVPAEKANAVNALVMRLNLPWGDLHKALVTATPPDVALLSLQPDARKRSLRITAEARASDDMLGYVERLEQLNWFASVTLVRHEISDQDPNRPIRFQIETHWRQP